MPPKTGSGCFRKPTAGPSSWTKSATSAHSIQTKLLRVLQEKEIKPLGDTRSIQVDVRVVASTNRNLEEKIRRGEFREDLYYRLNVLPIVLPPCASGGRTSRRWWTIFLPTLCRAGQATQRPFPQS